MANNHDNFLRVISVLSVNCVKRALDQRTRMQMSTSFIRGGLVPCFLPCLLAHVICYVRLKTRSFTLVILFFLFACFHEKKIVITAIMLCMHETLNKDFFYELKYKTRLCKSCDDFY